MSLATSNIFAALETKKKKKSSKSSKEGHDKKKAATKADRPPAVEQQNLFSAQAKVPISNWADTDEDDDFVDDLGPLPESWLPPPAANGSAHKDEDDGTDSDEELRNEEINKALGIEISKDEDEDEDDDGPADGQADEEEAEPTTGGEETKPVPAAVQERQLSKKEQKRLELEEMNRVLAELGIAPETPAEQPKEKGSDQSPSGIEDSNGVETAEAAAKKKKKKDKERKLVTAVSGEQVSAATAKAEDPPSDEAVELVDPAEAKKLLAKKKAAAAAKKSSSSAAALAAKEAKERASKKAKAKDKKNYNQAPTR